MRIAVVESVARTEVAGIARQPQRLRDRSERGGFAARKTYAGARSRIVRAAAPGSMPDAGKRSRSAA